MGDSTAPMSKYIPWILSAILLILVIVSVNQLYKAKLTEDLLKVANDKLTEKQLKSESVIKAQNDSIRSYHIQLKEINKRREGRKARSNDLKKQHGKEIQNIVSDDAVTDANAIADIYRTYSFD